MSELSDTIRVQWAKADAKRDEGLTTPDEILRYDNIQYGDDAKWNVLDIYRLKSEEGRKLPVIISIHGGGFVYGDKELYQYYCMDLAKRGFAVVNFSYRLAPECKYPAQLYDTNSVIKWVLDNADKYMLDTNNVFALGDSAGGNLVGTYCNILTNNELSCKFDFDLPKNFIFNAVAINCGVLVLNDKKVLDESGDTDDMLDDYLGTENKEEYKNQITVTDYINKKFPPAFVMTAEMDFLKMHAPMLSMALAKNCVPHELHFYTGNKGPLYHVFHVDIKSDMAKQCNDDECNFFRKYLV